MRKRLEFQADQIEAVLTVHKVPARVTGGTVTPRWVRFQVLPAEGTDTSRIKELRVQIASALEVPKSECQVLRRGVTVTVEIMRNDPQPVQFGPLYRQLQSDGKFGGIPPMTAVLGLAEDGAPLLIRLPSPDVGNILVVGAEGAGKTSLLRLISLSLQWANPGANLCNVYIVDDLETCDHARQADVIRLARQSDQHVIAATADVDLAESIKALFPACMIGRGGMRNGTGAEHLMGRGDFLAVAKGQVHRFQAAFIGANEAAFRTEWAEQNGQLLKACQSGLTMPRLS